MTNAGTVVEQRSIILVPFPFSDLSSSKKRPALVISNTEFNKKNEDVVCCLITSNPKTENAIKITNKDMETGHLDFDSFVKPQRMFTVSKTIIYKTLGKLNKNKCLLTANEIGGLVKVR
ncbi:MAG: type II toxin-antitoxin system PemK/MazF family toxin [Candidatus Aenigmarchaeota archaeon]|nr:type II toxin-antitoxin system PemK/MazF family toxin [Candidatus Aenigmarchaeota archaeon]